MAMSMDIPFKTYILKMIFGFGIFLFGGINFNIILTNGKTLSDNFRNFGLILTFYIVLMFVGFIVFFKGQDVWKHIENLEVKRVNLENNNLELQNKKLKLEIKVLEKNVKNKKKKTSTQDI